MSKDIQTHTIEQQQQQQTTIFKRRPQAITNVVCQRNKVVEIFCRKYHRNLCDDH